MRTFTTLAGNHSAPLYTAHPPSLLEALGAAKDAWSGRNTQHGMVRSATQRNPVPRITMINNGLGMCPLFDHVVVATVSSFFSFDAGPDWILYEGREGLTACRLMVSRDLRSLRQTVDVEAVVAMGSQLFNALM
jgi:hypothetical protein